MITAATNVYWILHKSNIRLFAASRNVEFLLRIQDCYAILKYIP